MMIETLYKPEARAKDSTQTFARASGLYVHQASHDRFSATAALAVQTASRILRMASS